MHTDPLRSTRRRLRHGLCVVGLVIALTASWRSLPLESSSSDWGPTALVVSTDNARLYVSQQVARRVDRIDARTGAVQASLSLPSPPGDLALSADGALLAVCLPEGAGQVVLIDTARLRVVHSVTASPGVCSPIFTPDRTGVWLCGRFSGTVMRLDLASRRIVQRVPAGREPIRLAHAPKYGLLAVVNHLPEQPATDPAIASAVRLFDARSLHPVRKLLLPPGGTSARGICIAPDSRHAVVTHTLGRFQTPTSQLQRGWMNTNALSVIDLAQGRRTATVLLDSLDRGAPNPWAIASLPSGRLVVTLSGSAELVIIDWARLISRIGQPDPCGALPQNALQDALIATPAWLHRHQLPDTGPRTVVALGDTVWTAGYFSNTVTRSVEQPDLGWRSSVVTRGARQLSSLRYGEMLFHDATACFQQWQSCASCHPDGRADGLNWDLLNDGLGNPKNTRSLLLSPQTPPVMITGIRPDARTAVNTGLRFIQMAELSAADGDAIEQWIRSLKPRQSPIGLDPRLRRSIQRGKRLFQSAGCAGCHPAPLYTDLKRHVVRCGDAPEDTRAFDTPTLVEVWRSAPWLYDGRATDMESVLTRHNKYQRHGRTNGLTVTQRRDLVNYTLSR